MVDHVRTLLMNEPASIVDGVVPWHVDPSFRGVRLTPDLAAVHALLFGDNPDLHRKISVVSDLMPFTASPEFEWASSVFDKRKSIDDRKKASTAFRFYTTMGSSLTSNVVGCLASPACNTLFDGYDSGMSELCGTLKKLKQVFLQSNEVSARFSAILLGYLVRVEMLRRKSLAA